MKSRFLSLKNFIFILIFSIPFGIFWLDRGIGDGIFYQVLIFCSGGVLLISALQLVSEKRNNIVFEKRASIFLALFLAGGIISSAFASFSYRAWLEFFILLSCVVIFFILTQTDQKFIRIISWLFVLMSSAIAIYALIDILRGYYLDGRAYAPLYNPNLLAGYFLGLWPLSIIFFFKQKNEWLRLGLFLNNILIGAIFILTVSYTGWLTFILLLPLIVYLLKKEIFCRKNLILIFIVLALVFLGVVASRYSAGLNFQKSLLVWRVVDSGHAAASFSQRMIFLKDGFNIFLDHFFQGVGLKNFTFVYWKIAKTSFELPISAHNYYMDIIVSLGIFGIIGFAGFVIYSFFKFLKFARSREDIYFTALFLGWTAMAINAGIDYNWELRAILLNFWIFSGLLYAVIIKDSKAKYELKIKYNLLPIAISVIGLVLIFRGFILFLGKNFDTNASRYQLLGDNAKAVSLYNKSWKINGNPEELTNIAQIYFFEENPDWTGAESAAKNIIKYTPEYHYGYQLLGRIYSIQGKFEESLVQYEKALEKNPQFNTGLKLEYLGLNMKLKNYSLVAKKAREYADYLVSQKWPDLIVAGRNQSISNFLNLELAAYKAMGQNDKTQEIKNEIAIFEPTCRIVNDSLSKISNLN